MNRYNMFRTYRNRRRYIMKNNLAIFICIILIFGYGFVKFKKADIKSLSDVKDLIVSKVTFGKKSVYTYKDLEDELNGVVDSGDSKTIDTTAQSTDEDTNTKSEDTNNQKSDVATINPWKVYAIQVASTSDESKLKKIKDTLEESKIPFSFLKKGDVEKVQTYCAFNKEDVRKYLDEIKKKFSDAFISEIDVPVISLKYTDKYSQIKDISNSINELRDNFEDETKYWNKVTSATNVVSISNEQEYKDLIKKRQDITTAIELNVNKI
ncbi:MAG: hypothetical protein LBR30_00425, partial [Clostridioides sp.]|nr:hypothetical protein [Clostridioides sp.]